MIKQRWRGYVVGEIRKPLRWHFCEKWKRCVGSIVAQKYFDFVIHTHPNLPKISKLLLSIFENANHFLPKSLSDNILRSQIVTSRWLPVYLLVIVQLHRKLRKLCIKHIEHKMYFIQNIRKMVFIDNFFIMKYSIAKISDVV